MKTRIITAVIALALFIPIVVIGGTPFTILIYLMGSIGLFELLRMKKISILSVPGIVSILLLWVLLFPVRYIEILNDINISKVGTVFLAVMFFLTYTVMTKNKFTFDDVGFTIISTLYVGVGFYFFIETRILGLENIFFAMFLIWATDSGAYFIGKKFGKNKLWPEISPNKTIEGFFGGIASAVLVAFIFQEITHFVPSYFQLIIISIFVSIFGQIGDLVESALKRHYHVKDSGSILPGHGGILDRFDSLLFVLPILYFLLTTL
ncbi:phosphatidate cytidylyltransferase [Aeribacillus alveayuensis]|uniref:Phosphatidate cytidylyltransferase n=1 Tax=Aeribacillus alveayuensis TaxID=279215 RepID=A0ABT9VLB7_9BACI|nr:phosphatidate cytidylyltransferase [Bacillus alveayuensis]